MIDGLWWRVVLVSDPRDLVSPIPLGPTTFRSSWRNTGQKDFCSNKREGKRDKTKYRFRLEGSQGPSSLSNENQVEICFSTLESNDTLSYIETVRQRGEEQKQNKI